MNRRTLLAAFSAITLVALTAALAPIAQAQSALEKPKINVAVGGKS